MSRLKSITSKVVSDGEARRGTFVAGGWAYDIYKWWRGQTKRRIGRENFCHYCRVVAIWAPLLAVKLAAKWFFTRKPTWVTLIVMAVGLIIWGCVANPGEIGSAVLILLAIIYAVAGILNGVFVGLLLDGKFTEGDITAYPWWIWLCVTLTLPVAPLGIVCYLVAKMLSSKQFKRGRLWMVRARLVRGYISPLAAVFYALYVAIVVWCVLSAWWLAAGIMTIGVAALFVIAFAIWCGFGWLGAAIERRRTARVAIQTERGRSTMLLRLEPLFWHVFLYYHPKKERDAVAYEAWRSRYEIFLANHIDDDYWQEGTDVRMVVRWMQSAMHYPVELGRQLDQLVDIIKEAELAGLELRKLATARKPSHLLKVLRGSGDLLVLVAQFIRVKKWKICPIVELPD